MNQQRTDQPSNVTTEEAPRPQDEHVVTSDTDFIAEVPAGPRETDHSDSAASDTPAQSTSDSDSGTPPKKAPASRRNRSAERRIKTLSSKLSDAEAREAENARKIAGLEETVSSLQTATPKAKEPMLADFANPREYAQAYSKWDTANETPAPRKRSATPKPKPIDDGTPPATPQDDAIIAFRAEGKKKLGDEFLEALEVPGTAVNQVMGEFMIDSDVGPELYVHLADNQDDAKKIFDMSAHKAIAALQRLATKARKGELIDAAGTLDVDDGTEETILENTGKTERIQTQVGTKAPEPPSDPSPGQGADTPAKSPEKESMDEYAARRGKEEARKKGFIVN
jgi:hypothetical protein